MQAEVFNLIDQKLKKYFELLEKICNIESNSADFEGVRAVNNALCDYAQGLGFAVRKQEYAGAGATAVISMNEDSDQKPLMFSGHMDTVSFGNEEDWTDSPLSGKVKDGKLYGRGSYDMKGGLAAAAMAVKCLKDLEVPVAGPVYVETVIDEEYGGAMGTLAGRIHGPNPDMAVIPEPTNLTMYPAHLGGCTFRARFSGVSGISFAGETFVNALEGAARFVAIMKDYKEYRNKNITVPEWWDKDWELDC